MISATSRLSLKYKSRGTSQPGKIKSSLRQYWLQIKLKKEVLLYHHLYGAHFCSPRRCQSHFSQLKKIMKEIFWHFLAITILSLKGLCLQLGHSTDAKLSPGMPLFLLSLVLPSRVKHPCLMEVLYNAEECLPEVNPKTAFVQVVFGIYLNLLAFQGKVPPSPSCLFHHQ